MSSFPDDPTFARDEVELLTSVDGERVALHDFGGDASGPPLLLCHGNGLNAGMWAGALPVLTGRFRCYGLDLRGHGRSRPIHEDYSVARHLFAADIVTAVDAIGGPVRFAGHSLGAASAAFAAMADSSPFVGLWLFEPVLLPDDVDLGGGPPSILVEMSRRRRMDFDSVDDAVARFRSKPPFSLCDLRAVRGYVEVGTYATGTGVRLSCRGEDEARVYGSSTPFAFAGLGTIDVPVLVASGAAANEANALPPKLAPLVAKAVPGGRWVEFDGISHFGPMEEPERMGRSIIDFFEEIGHG